jgi:hypothetical protein
MKMFELSTQDELERAQRLVYLRPDAFSLKDNCLTCVLPFGWMSNVQQYLSGTCSEFGTECNDVNYLIYTVFGVVEGQKKYVECCWLEPRKNTVIETLLHQRAVQGPSFQVAAIHFSRIFKGKILISWHTEQ